MRAHLIVLTLLGVACAKEEPPEPETPKESAAVLCFQAAKKLGELNTDGRISLCAGATDPEAPIRCFEDAKRVGSLNTNGRVHLCSGALDLMTIRVSKQLSGAERVIEQLRGRIGSLDTKLNEQSDKLDELARKLDQKD